MNKEAAITRKTIADAVRPGAAQAGPVGRVRQAQSGRAVAQPGDVRRLHRQHPHHAAVAAGAATTGRRAAGFVLAVSIWLWFTVLFANFAEALAEGRSKAQAASLRGLRQTTWAKKLAAAAPWTPPGCPSRCREPAPRRRRAGRGPRHDPAGRRSHRRRGLGRRERRSPANRRPSCASRAATSRPSPAARACCRTGWWCASPSIPGESFLDRMIGMVEAAKRQKTPNEIALTILLIALTIVFLVVTVTLLPYSVFSVEAAKAGTVVSVTALVALLVCLIPTTIGGLLSAVGVAGMSRMMQANVIATSGRAVEAAGDVDVLLLDKTGTITHGNRQASLFVAGAGRHRGAPGARRGAGVAGRRNARRPQHRRAGTPPAAWTTGPWKARVFLPFTAQTRMSGVDVPQAGGATAGGAQGRGRRGAQARAGPGRNDAGRSGARGRRDRAARQHAAGRGRGRQGAGRRSNSRTSSRPASRSALASCAAWASRP